MGRKEFLPTHFCGKMKIGDVVRIRSFWSLDQPFREGLRWDMREAAENESFILLTNPFWVSESYVGMMLQGSQGIEMITACVINKKAFEQVFEQHILAEYK